MAEKAWYAAALGGVEDRDRHKMEEPYYWGFLSRDVTAPQVTATDPASNAPDGYPDEPLTAWYDEAVDWPSQVQGQGNSFTLVGPGGGVSGTVGVVLDLYGRSGIRFTPASTLTAQARYTATIVGAVDLCSNAALTHTWSFTTTCLVDAAALELAPARCDRSEVVFQTSAVFFQSSGGSTMTVAAYEWALLAANGYEVLTTVVTTAPTLARELPYPGEVRWVRVRGQDAAGCLTHWSLGQELSWEGCYPGAPQVVGVSPQGQQTGVTVTAGLVVTLSEVVYAPAVLQDSLTQVRLYGGGSAVAGQWDFAERYDGQWAWGARFTPTSDLAEKTWHLGSVTGMKDSHGNRMTAPYGWVFRTGDYTPPEVAAVYPAGEEQEDEGQEPASPDVVLTVTFDERLDETRLDEVEFSLVGPGGAVSGTLALQPSMGQETVVRFTPGEQLVKEARYTATVVGAVDLAGNVMAEAHMWVFHVDAAGGGIHSGTAERVRQTYAFGGKAVAIRERAREVERVYWLHPDHLGSTTLVTNADGEKAAERRYLPWGEERYVDADVPTDRLYTGQIKDHYTNLYYYNARYYDPWLGRFVQADTVQPNPGDPQQLNRFGYTRDNPVRHIDSTGHYIDEGSYLEAASGHAAYSKIYSPRDAQEAWGVGTAMRVSWETDQAHLPPKSDFELIAAMTCPLWIPAAGVGIAALGDAALMGATAAAPYVAHAAGVAASAAGRAASAVGQAMYAAAQSPAGVRVINGFLNGVAAAAGDYVTQGSNPNWRQSLAVGGVAFLGGVAGDPRASFKARLGVSGAVSLGQLGVVRAFQGEVTGGQAVGAIITAAAGPLGPSYSPGGVSILKSFLGAATITGWGNIIGGQLDAGGR